MSHKHREIVKTIRVLESIKNNYYHIDPVYSGIDNVITYLTELAEKDSPITHRSSGSVPPSAD
jgi:hypothetical protein